MISVKEATEITQAHPLFLADETVPLLQAYGRVLRENLTADRDFPPFDRVMMDGIAICYETFTMGLRVFPIQEMLAAGGAAIHLKNPGHCIEVMTGAVLPAGTDTVIRYEDLEINRFEQPHVVKVMMDRVRFGQNIHRKGSDHEVGSELLGKGTLMGAPEIGVAATVGKTHIRVTALPRIAIISTGDEIVGVEQTPLPHQIRSSNAEVLMVSLREMGLYSDRFHLPDSEAEIHRKLAGILENYEVIILSGGVSQGKYDFIPGALEKLGVEKCFHQVAQRPGKPFWFGVKGENERVVFALPGNPVSTYLNFVRYVKPWLKKSMGLGEEMPFYATLAEPFTFGPELAFFLQVRVETGDDGHIFAFPEPASGSGDHASLIRSDGFLELPANQKDFAAGENFPLWLYRPLPPLRMSGG
ncbi:MAG: molybdopterin molybdotransferase MoeA [Bacteroidia bacterium]|nr:molybdopterin molybdotransferase MoeA [Bacteroidia bacterium]